MHELQQDPDIRKPSLELLVTAMYRVLAFNQTLQCLIIAKPYAKLKDRNEAAVLDPTCALLVTSTNVLTFEAGTAPWITL